MAIGWILPFAAILLSIAVFPLAAPHFWESNRNKALVTGALALPTLGLLLATDPGALAHTALEYGSFMALLGSLYVVSAGVLVTGDVRATPAVNTLILAIGAVLANVIGTTGASMLLVRPLLQINSERHRTTHVLVFFIFVVSNCGGCLTPLGDPPLFLGYLRGVPFFWTAVHLWPAWAFMVAALLALHFVVDSWAYRHEKPRDLALDDATYEPLRVQGAWNFLLFGVIVAVVLGLSSPLREVAMLAVAWSSYRDTPAEVRRANGFGFGPIVEVAVLFAAIFVAMVPALRILEARAPDLGIESPRQFFLWTGGLSSLLDNAPTYLTVLTVARGTHGVVPDPILVAISLGAVFMGANTYIGNGPNFMVKAIAERAGVKMPSFFGYMAWAAVILWPLLAVVGILFLS